MARRKTKQGNEAASLKKDPSRASLRSTKEVDEDELMEMDINSSTAVNINSTRNVTLYQEELEQLIDARAEAMAEARTKELEARILEMEGLLKYFLGKERESLAVGPSPPDAPPQDLEEPMQLVENQSPQQHKPKEEDDWHAPFGESVYSLLYITKTARSQGFWYGIFVYGLQIAAILLTQINILDLDSKDNPLKLPPMVDPAVTLAQGITLFIALAFQSDLIEATLKLQDGFHPEVLETHPGATFSTWLISCLAQLFAGFLLLATNFILTMQVDDVLSIMLNFAALHFMAEIDDIGFAIAKWGFVTNKIQRETMLILDFRVQKRKTLNRSRRVLYVLTLGGLFAGYGILKNRQLDGKYLPTNIYVQFGDAYNSKIPHYSGILTSVVARTAIRREYHDLGQQNSLILAYCQAEKSWTFSEGDDPCDYFAKSRKSTTYDVTTIPDTEWEVLDSIGRLQPFDSFSLVSRDCDPKTCQGMCGADGLCQCDNHQFGIDCEFSNATVCQKLLIDRRFEPFPSYDDGWAVSDEFELLSSSVTREYVKAYTMPVYYSNKTYPSTMIFFSGRRWILTSEMDFINITEAEMEQPSKKYFPEKSVAIFENNFHAFHGANYTPRYMSDPVDFETPDFLPTPIGLNWWTVQSVNWTARHFETDAPISTILTCKTPSSCVGGQGSLAFFAHLEVEERKGQVGFCGAYGNCNAETGLCECLPTYYGERCELQMACYEEEIPCSGSGIFFIKSHGDGICGQSSGMCRCNLPWYDKLCGTEYYCYEEGGKCRNGGVCNFTTDHCDCPGDPAISGVACEKRADCGLFGCANGGICSLNGACVCRPPFHGAHCDLLDTTVGASVHLEVV